MPLFHYQNTNITIIYHSSYLLYRLFQRITFVGLKNKKETHKIQCRKCTKLLSMVFDKYYERTYLKKKKSNITLFAPAKHIKQ